MKGKVEKAVALGRRVRYVFLTTADNTGWPHVTVASKIRILSSSKVAIFSWFCPKTMENIKDNLKMGIIIWDKDTDTGYQMLGKLAQVKEIAMLDGYVPDIEKKTQLPQAARELTVEIESVLEFKESVHSDSEVD